MTPIDWVLLLAGIATIEGWRWWNKPSSITYATRVYNLYKLKE